MARTPTTTKTNMNTPTFFIVDMEEETEEEITARLEKEEKLEGVGEYYQDDYGNWQPTR